MNYPIIDPIIFELGPIAPRWYGMTYLAGFLAVWWLGRRRVRSGLANWSPDELSDIVFYGALGAVLGGRLGYVLFYAFDQFLAEPLMAFRIWEGGMSFHGGFLGVLAAMIITARRQKRTFLATTDFLVPLVPPGLGFGRLGNFINAELPGRVSESGFGLNFPCDAVIHLNRFCSGAFENVARHPSSLYQAFAEGVVLFVIVWLYSSKKRPTGAVTGLFIACYGALRFCTEFFREPDADIGFIAFNWLSMGQALSIPMLLAGILLLLWALRRPEASATSVGG